MSPKSIIIAEDEDEMRNALARALSTHGYRVRAVNDGTQVLALCKSEMPDLVITDVFMPQRDGFEVMKELRKEFPQVKIITMSGHLDAHAMRHVKEQMGSDLSLTKPFLLAKVLEAVRSLVS